MSEATLKRKILSWKWILEEYLLKLNARNEWKMSKAQSEVNNIVWIFEAWTPRGTWPLNRMRKTFTGLDKTASSYEVKAALGLPTRPAIKLIHFIFPNPAPAA